MNFYKYLNDEYVFLNEMSMGSNFVQATTLMAAYLSKVVGTLSPFGAPGEGEEYKKANGKKGLGLRFLSLNGVMLRFNWDKGRDSNFISSVDYWAPGNKDFGQPTLNINIPYNMNSVQIVKNVEKVLKDKKVGDFEIIGESEDISEGPKKSEEEWRDLAAQAGIDPNQDIPKIRKLLRKIEVSKGVAETNSVGVDGDKAQKMFEKQKYADPETIFEDLKELVSLVLKGIQPSLIVCGGAGLDKTYTITDQIKQSYGPEGRKWIKITGKISTFGLYSALFLHKDKLIVFDDTDSVFASDDTNNILKAALDSYDTRMISWYSKQTIDVSKLSPADLVDFYDEIEEKLGSGDSSVKLPNRFEFKGKIIFISNLSESKIDNAVKSRSFVIDINLKREDVIKRMETLLPHLGSNSVTLDVKREVLRELEAYEGPQAINMRSFLKALRIREGGNDRWRELIRKFI